MSLSSPIVGIQNLQYKYIYDAHVIFIPNCNFNWDTVSYALFFFRILMGTPFSSINHMENMDINVENGSIKTSKNVLVEHNKYVKINNSVYVLFFFLANRWGTFAKNMLVVRGSSR